MRRMTREMLIERIDRAIASARRARMSDTTSALNLGCSVTQRIKQIKQPRGGYIPPKMFKAVSLGDGIDALNPEEKCQPYTNRHSC